MTSGALSRPTIRMLALGLGLAGAIALNACGDAPPPAAPATPTRSAEIGTRLESPVPLMTVNANTASVDSIERAFRADGIPTPARWARAVVQYRPYPTDDPSFAKLRRELAKYNQEPELADQIIAALTL